MAKYTIEEIIAWWKEIERLERKGAAVDILSFAETAHEYIPLLLAELARLKPSRDGLAEQRIPRTQSVNTLSELVRTEIELPHPVH